MRDNFMRRLPVFCRSLLCERLFTERCIAFGVTATIANKGATIIAQGYQGKNCIFSELWPKWNGSIFKIEKFSSKFLFLNHCSSLVDLKCKAELSPLYIIDFATLFELPTCIQFLSKIQHKILIITFLHI